MNERMTKRDTDGQAMMDCEKCKADWTGKHGKPMSDCTALYCRNRLLDRLVAYEDTGWTPEMLHKLGENAGLMWDFAQAAEKMTVGRLKELAEADKDGRCVVLPCKVGVCAVAERGQRAGVPGRWLFCADVPIVYQTQVPESKAA